MEPAQAFARDVLAVRGAVQLAAEIVIHLVRMDVHLAVQNPAVGVPGPVPEAVQGDAEIHAAEAVRDVRPAADRAVAEAVALVALAAVRALARVAVRAVAEAAVPDVPALAVEAAPDVQGLVQVAVMDVLVLVQKDAQGIAMGLV